VKSAKSVAFSLFPDPAGARRQETPRLPQIFTDIQERRAHSHSSDVLRAVPGRGMPIVNDPG
jgi:hypothetical protein